MAASQYSCLTGEIRDLLEKRCGQFMTELTDGSMDKVTDVILSQHISNAFQDYYALKDKFAKDNLDCAVLALAKSGKSTLLNAFCGAALLPSNNVPETARIVALQHTQLQANEEPILTYKAHGEIVKVEKEHHIRAHLEYLNKEVRGRRHKKDDESVLTVRTELSALKDEPTNVAVGLRLLDTSGPNEAGEEALKHSVERLLDSIDAVVYVLDYTKLKTKEEAELLSKLSDSNPQLIQRLAQRLFFVVNKIDETHVTEGLNEEETREYVADLVTRQMNIPSFQLRPDQVFLVSAQDALLSRLILNDKATTKERDRFAKKAFGRNWSRKTDGEFKETAQAMLEESHVLELEDCLLGYLYEHAGILKLVSLLDGIVRLLTQIKNVASTGQAAMKVSSESLASEIHELKSTLLSTSHEFAEVRRQASAVENDVVQSVKQRMQNLRTRLLLHIDEVLNPGTEGSDSKQSPWGWIIQKSSALLTRHRSQPSENDAALKAKLSDLHGDIKKQIEAEITEFWHELETATNAKHKELISVINSHLMELARNIEGSVGKVLDLCLKPLDICLQKPTAEQFHSSIQDLLTNGIRRGTKTETKHRREEHVEWQRRWRGLCNQSEYWTGVPTERWVAYQEEKTVFDLNPESIKEHFQTMVNSSIDISVERVKDYVHAFMSDQIFKAHEKITSYSTLYTDTMVAVLDSKCLGVAEQQASLTSIEGRIAFLDDLLESASKIAKKVSKMFPHLEMDNFEWIETDSFEAKFDVARETQDQKTPEIAAHNVFNPEDLGTSIPKEPVAVSPEQQQFSFPVATKAPIRGASILGDSSESDSEDDSEEESEEEDEEPSYDSAYDSDEPDKIYDDTEEEDSEEEDDFDDEDEIDDEDDCNEESSEEEVDEDDEEEQYSSDSDDSEGPEDFKDGKGADVTLTDEEKHMFPSLAESLGLVPAPVVEKSTVKEEQADPKEIKEEAKPKDSESWIQQKLAKLVSDLGVTEKQPELPISNDRATIDTESEKAGHFVSAQSSIDHKENEAESSNASEGGSDDWECVSETEIHKTA